MRVSFGTFFPPLLAKKKKKLNPKKKPKNLLLLTVAPYSESGMPSCSESMSMSLSSKSEMRSAFLDSNMKVTTSPEIGRAHV